MRRTGRHVDTLPHCHATDWTTPPVAVQCRAMFRHVPNALTALRLLLAVVFFGMLSYYQHLGQFGRHGDLLWLNIAFVVYVAAMVTDYLDGHLARRWHVEGAFGRVVDPFVDKVLVLGSFIFFAGKNFTIPQPFDPQAIPGNVTTITGVVPWMVVVILARELLVTSLRGMTEGRGQSFGAVWIGKLKMSFQSATILVILIYVNYLGWYEARGYQGVARVIRDIFIWGTVIVTTASGLQYVWRAVVLYRERPTGEVKAEGVD
jgi:CDP-diacylglycerol---glycerol-3-phosphate 3-phosphatidyltransferase